MQPTEFLRYIESPSAVDASAVKELDDLVRRFPYFQGAHLLLSVASKRWDASLYQETLKRTAIVVTDRSRLFKLVHAPASAPISLLEPVNTAPVTEPAKVQEPVIAEEKQLRGEDKAPAPPVTETIAEAAVAPPEAIHAQNDEEAAISAVDVEMGRQVVASLVEKQLLGDPERPVALPGSFGDWLSYLKKNNGQPYAQIEADVRASALAQKQDEKPKAAGIAEKAAGKGEAVERRPQQSEEGRRKRSSIIDKIIEKNPGVIRSKEEKFFTAESRAKESLQDNEHLVTETLARIYALQGNNSKAIRAYEILSLKFPQKSAYFAAQIEKLRQNT